MAKNKIKEEYVEEDASKNVLNSLMQGYKDDHYNHINEPKEKISTGSIILDSVLGGGVETGTSFRALGPYSSGKTSQCMLLMYNYLQTIPNSKGLFFKAERLTSDLAKRSGLKFVNKADDWDIGTVMLIDTNVFEVVAGIMEGLLKSTYSCNQKLFILVDSLDNLILKNDLTSKDISGGTKVAGIPLMSKLLYRRVGILIEKYNAILAWTSQQSAYINLNPYDKNERPANASGGASIAHMVSYAFEYTTRYNKDLILEKPDEKPDALKNKIIGVYCPIIIRKATNETENAVCRIPIRKGRSINSVWIEKEIVDYCLGWELIRKAGAWFSFDESLVKEAKDNGVELQEKIQGLDGVYSYFETNKNVFDWFYKKIKGVLSN